ncbi:MAG: tRNA epoxyqueuosine(34) reductase QueG [Burkholderiaceae bacterium]
MSSKPEDVQQESTHCATHDAIDATQAHALAQSIKRWGRELGFFDVAICDALPRDDVATEVAQRTEERLRDWLAQGFHGTMDYMARHGMRRGRPSELVPGTVSVITVRMDYLPQASIDAAEDAGIDEPSANWVDASWNVLHDRQRANVSRYAHGRDYHKVLRARLQRLADRIADAIGPFGHRVFTDSAPVMEVELAQRAGLGWRGKHTLLLSRTGGSMFFLGELFVDVPLPADAPASDHCGRCTRCIAICPTRAIVAPHVLDARRCIAYLTIELEGPIPEEYRPLIGNRIYGCDDCQLICPWNKFAKRSSLPDFDARPLAHETLIDVFAWCEKEFLAQTQGTVIRRIGHERWLRNVAVALGNALASDDASISDEDRVALRAALEARRDDPSALVREHVAWALAQRPASTPATAPR